MRAFFEWHVGVKSLLKTILNFCVLQVLTKELISANRGDGQQNSLAEHIMQKFIEVFHCLCLLQAIFKLLHFTVLSVIVSGVFFPDYSPTLCICALFVGGVFSRAFFLFHIFCTFHTFHLALSTGDAFSRALQRLDLVLAVCFPALSIGYTFSHARFAAIQFRLLSRCHAVAFVIAFYRHCYSFYRY